MQTLGLDEATPNAIDTSAPYVGFWKRQFQQEHTLQQNIFDWAFGVVLPVTCFFFDPIVFEAKSGGSVLGMYKPFAYLFTFASIMALMAWLLWRERLKGLSAVLLGLFVTGGIFSLGVGLILFPFSVIGLVVLIGALGFTPLFTSFVFFRNSVRAARVGKVILDKRVLVGSAVLAGLFAIVVPYLVNTEIERRLRLMETCDLAEFQANARTLRLVSPLLNLDRLVQKTIPYSVYGASGSPRAQAVAKFYKEVKGADTEPFPFD